MPHGFGMARPNDREEAQRRADDRYDARELIEDDERDSRALFPLTDEQVAAVDETAEAL
jgi:hypothetical protein